MQFIAGFLKYRKATLLPKQEYPKSKSKHSDLCWYHYKSSDNAQKCVQPCLLSSGSTGKQEKSLLCCWMEDDKLFKSRHLFVTNLHCGQKLLVDYCADILSVQEKLNQEINQEKLVVGMYTSNGNPNFC